jgi:hypothetical protein
MNAEKLQTPFNGGPLDGDVWSLPRDQDTVVFGHHLPGWKHIYRAMWVDNTKVFRYNGATKWMK